jgi:hypothetical protein
MIPKTMELLLKVIIPKISQRCSSKKLFRANKEYNTQ